MEEARLGLYRKMPRTTVGRSSRIGPYEVIALIGEGGMGKVWRARHAALNRDDALGVSIPR
jgi:serine/threonine protein kinase